MAYKLFGKATPITSRLFPKATSPRGLTTTFPLADTTTYTMSLQLSEIGLEQINGVFVDNSNNGSGFTLYNPVTYQLIYIPANSQGRIALITPNGSDNLAFTGTSTGGVDIPVIFTNVEPMSDSIWSTVAAGSIIGAVTVQGQVTALAYNSAGLDAAALSITTGGTAQVLFGANAARKGLLISNPASGPSQGLGAVAPESIFIRFGANASGLGVGGNIEIVPGGYFNPLAAADNRSISIWAATTGHVFTATQFQ